MNDIAVEFWSSSAPIPTRTLDKIKSFTKLRRGWHYGRGGPISREILDIAADLHGHLMMIGLTRTDAFAGADGEVLLTAYHNDHYVGVTIESKDKIAVRHEGGDRDVSFVEELNVRKAKNELLRIVRGIWTMSVSYTQRISTTFGADSMTSASRTLPVEACLLFSLSVSHNDQA
jgi:hypothetical protein